jgi:ATP-binding cassette subfamily F protein 3
LLLDEPTNHLDIPSQEVLQNVLADFDGTVILVSHDRYLINALATQIWEIDKGRRALKIFGGTYGDYRARKAAEAAATDPGAEERRSRKREAFRKARAAKNREITEERRRKARLEDLEARTHRLEEELDTLGRQLANPPADRGKVQRLGEAYMRAEHDLEAVMEEWEEFQD